MREYESLARSRREQAEKTEARERRIAELKELRRGYATKHILISVEVLDDLLAVYDATEALRLQPGDLVTWGCAAISAKVVTCDRFGLCLEYANGVRETFSGLRRPAGLVRLPADAPFGKLPERSQDAVIA